jgi:hypothetical protein
MNFNLGSKQNIVTEDQIKNNENAIVYDVPEGEANIENLPDVKILLKKVTEILEYMCTDEMIALKNEDTGEYNKQMEEKFSVFSNRYYSIFHKLLSGEDLTPLFSMLAAIEKVKNGEVTMETAEKQLGNILAKKYIHEKEE